MHGLISSLGDRHEIAILTFKGRDEDLRDSIAATSSYASLIVTVVNSGVGQAGGQRRRGQLRSLLMRRSYERQSHHVAGYQRALQRLCERWKPDAIVIEFAQMGYYEFPAGIPVILDAHNVEHEIISRMAEVEPSFARRVYSAINGWKLRREEASLVRKVDGIAVTSNRDRGIFEQLVPGVSAAVIPNGVDTDHFRPTGDIGGGHGILFFGALDYFPNEDAVIYFHREVWPLLKEAHPDLVWTVVGREPGESIAELGDQPGIEVKGFVDDVRTAIEGAAVIIVPLRAGSGTRLKILEAMAMGKPVVTTALGAEGLDVLDGEHLIVANYPTQFARAVSSLLDDPETRRQFGKAARQTVEAHYDWDANARRFEELIGSVVVLGASVANRNGPTTRNKASAR